MASPYSIVAADQCEDAYAGSEVPGEFRSMTAALGSGQVGMTLIRVPPHSDFEQGTGHHHEQIEEVYLVTRVRSHRNCGEEPVEIWAISRRNDHGDATKVDDFWEASPDAAQVR